MPDPKDLLNADQVEALKAIANLEVALRPIRNEISQDIMAAVVDSMHQLKLEIFYSGVCGIKPGEVFVLNPNPVRTPAASDVNQTPLGEPSFIENIKRKNLENYRNAKPGNFPTAPGESAKT